MTDRLVADVLAAAARAQRDVEPTYGMLYLAKDAAELGEAETALQIADAATPKDSGDWFAVLATLHAMLGHGQDVEQLAAKALKAPSSSVHSALAEAYAQLGDFGRADKYIALVDEELRPATTAAVARIAIAAGDLVRAARLADQPGFRDAAPTVVAAMQIELALALAARGDLVTARQRLEDAETLDPDGRVVERAIAWANLGDQARARDLTARADTGRYEDSESLDVARAYEAAGATAKVDEILHTYAASEDSRENSSGYAQAALAYLRFGRELKVKKRLKAAETALAKQLADPMLAELVSGLGESEHASLATAYVLDRQFAKAIAHIAAMRDPDGRVQHLLELARALRDANVEATPELVSAVQALDA